MPHEHNRALTRHKLEAMAWEQTPRDYRGSSGSKREVLLNTTEGTTLVPLSGMTDFQLRRYIGPGRLEEAGDMRKNGSEEDLSFDLREYGASMNNWNSGQGDPIYAVGSYAYSGKIHPNRDTIESALAELQSLRNRTLRKEPRRELQELADQTQEILDLQTQTQTPNGVETPEAVFIEHLQSMLDIGDRQIYFRVSPPQAFVQFYNVPQGIETGATRENNRLMLTARDAGTDRVKIELTVRGPSFGEAYKLRSKTASTRKSAEYVAEFLNRAAKKAPYGHEFNNYEKNASRREEPDEQAARELSLYIENEYSLVGAPNSQGKAIEKSLEKKIKNGTFDLALSEKAWIYLMETGAKKYAKEYADGREWSKIFNKPTRELVAHEFATTFAEENGAKAMSRNANIEIEEFDAPAHWASAFINGDMTSFDDEEAAEFEAWQAKHPELGWVVDVSEETHFGRWNGLQTELATYTAHVQGS